MMRIGLDARSVGVRVCGVSRVTLRLIASLAALDAENEYIVFSDSDRFSGFGRPNFRIVRTGFSRMNPLGDLRFTRIIEKFDLDIFHSIHSWLPLNIGSLRTKKIVTVHDMFAVTDPDFFAKYGMLSVAARSYFSWLTESSIKKSDLVITVSNYSKKRIEEVMPSAMGKVRVVHNASGLAEPAPGDTLTSPAEGPYLLYVGNFRSYKNVPMLIEGFARYLTESGDKQLKLILAGNDKSELIESLIIARGISERISFVRNPDDAMLQRLYRGAVSAVAPSNEEGFGIPVLEAMQSGVPVIISDAGALVEVAGDAALIFRSGNPSDLAMKIRLIREDAALRDELIASGIERQAKFSWDKSAAALRQHYYSVLGAKI